jgi:Flp pilus assembly protein TadD
MLVLLVPAPFFLLSCKQKNADDFVRLTNVGKNYYDKGETEKAIAAFEKALALSPTHPDAHLNLANAYLLANQPEAAIRHAQEVLKLERDSGAAHYIQGCAYLRLGQLTNAVQSLQEAKKIDRTINAVSFQLGRAYQQLGQLEEALEQLQEVVQFEPQHAAAHYNLSQVLVRLGRTDEANQALAQHQKLNAGRAGRPADPALFERCQHTQARLPFKLQQPDRKGVTVTFADVTASAFGSNARNYHGPVGVIDLHHDGRNDLFVVESNGFRLLINTNGMFQPRGDILPGIPEAKYNRMLVADLNNDKYEDVLVLGDKGSHVFKFATNDAVTDISKFSRLNELSASDGLLADLDFTAKLDLIAIAGTSNAVRVLRNLGHPYFSENTTNSGVPLSLTGARQLLIEDWNNDDLQDLFVTRESQPPLLLIKQRGGPLMATNLPGSWPAGSIIAVGDLNNDLRSDLVIASQEQLVCVFNGLTEQRTIPLAGKPVTSLYLLDYDSDGWLDIIGAGVGLRLWRNLGNDGFEERTAATGLDKVVTGRVQAVVDADFDNDCDTDLLLTLEDGSLQLLRNNGGHANRQIKIHLVGNKSNASGLGIRLDVATGGLRLSRRVTKLPIEIGVGPNRQLDSLTVHWFDLDLAYADVKVDACSVHTLDEATLPTGSCPYLYAWDGKQFRFVTDLLGASPAGLRLTETRFIDADSEEYVWLGDESMFPPRDGQYQLQITEELREVLYLDEAKLVVVDHPAGTEVHTTGKLRPGKPFPPHEILTLHKPHPLLKAVNHEGADVTASLQHVDGKFVSPTQLRIPQLRGLAEPHSVTLDFGELPVERPLVLALTGWLRFGGGMANVAASHNPDLPFPFPMLEVETASGAWKHVDVVAGAPAGKTKRIVIELSGKLPAGSKRLRLSSAFEIHWDRIALLEKRDNSETRITVLEPTKSHLHWRGFSEYEALPWTFPLTPDYQTVTQSPKWTINPRGWCTRYGEIRELIARRDNALALLNAGDELTLSFASDRLSPRPEGAVRDFFLYTVGWDKDSDFHCELGWQVEPLPWSGMDDQRYGHQARPAFPNDALMQKYNTRWVGPYTLTKKK